MFGFWRRLTRGAERLIHRPDWPLFAGERASTFEGVMALPITDRFHAKQGRSTGRIVLRAGDDRLVVYLKRHYQLAWWRRLLATLWPAGDWSPAFAENTQLEWARNAGVPVPSVAAAGESIGPWLRLRSLLAVEELTGMLPLHEAVPLAQERLSPAAFTAWKRGLIAELVRLTRLLHDANRFHKDYYLCHFFVRQEEIEVPVTAFKDRVHLIDLHRLCRHRWLRGHWRVKDLAQLLYSSDVAGVSNRDRLRFLRLYVGGTRFRKAIRPLLRAIVRKASRYRRHNEPRSAAIPPRLVDGRKQLAQAVAQEVAQRQEVPS